MKIWEIDPLTFGKDLREMRTRKRLTRQELADKIHNASIGQVQRWEDGDVLPNIAVLIEICKVFGIDEVRINMSERWYR